jgi:glutamine amidotransferase
MKITIIDYGIGNILSVVRALTICGAQVIVSDCPADICKARGLILPGVGAFADGMKGLQTRNLIEPIKEYANTGLPLLGICLGMQMMLEISEEFGVHKGLGLIPGKVVKINSTTIEGETHKIPHIGWDQLKVPDNNNSPYWDNTILEGISEKDAVYFVHSYTAVPDNDGHRLADSFYGGRRVSAVVRKDNIYGCQFHPEKSGNVGLKIINNFLKLCENSR